jgi:hypothetical protein
VAEPLCDLPEGCVSRAHVLLVLAKAAEHGNFFVDVRSESSVTIFMNSVPDVYDLPEIVTRRMVQRLTNKYAVRPEWFYHPHMLGSAPSSSN